MKAFIKPEYKGRLPDSPEPTRRYRDTRPMMPFAHILQDNQMGRRGKDQVEERKHRTTWTQEDIDWMMELYHKGLSQQKIATEMGRSRSNVCYRLNEILKGKKREWRRKDEQSGADR